MFRKSPSYNGILHFLFCTFVVIVGCSKEQKIPCPNDFKIYAPIVVNYNLSRMKLGDTLQFRITIPFKNLNAFVGDSLDLAAYNDLWGGVTLLKYIKDSIVVPGGGPINSIPARMDFTYLSSNNIFQIPNDAGRPSPGAIFFRYDRADMKFHLNLLIIPKQKGTYLIQFLDSGFRDAECYNRINHTISGYRNTDFTYLLDEAVGRVIGGPDEYYPFNYVLRVE
jgi:hypothetical protein